MDGQARLAGPLQAAYHAGPRRHERYHRTEQALGAAAKGGIAQRQRIQQRITTVHQAAHRGPRAQA